MGGCIDNYSHFFYWAGPNRHDLWQNGKEVWRDGEFFGDLMVEQCKEFVSENRNQPFFLYWAINMPHYPLQGKEKWRKKYEHLDAPRRMYAAFVSTMDEMVGDVVEHIHRLGLREDTLIIWLSDHGHSVEQRTFGGGGNAGDYRGHKFTLWEGGIRIPCIVSWPGRIPKNAVRGQRVISVDWMPTIANYCNVRLHEPDIDGKNIAPIIKSAAAGSPHDILHWETGNHWAVRQGDWKLVHNGPATDYKGRKIPKAKDFLSNLAEDVTETRNLVDEHPDIVERLTDIHNRWLKRAQSST
jgi:arylsulfatase A-like enzyme